jgi:hypothetical protein
VLSFQQALDAAQGWFSELTKADASGVQIGPYTVADAARDWLAVWSGSETSKCNSEGNLKNHILPALGHIEVAKLKRQKVQEWLQELAAKPPVRRYKHLTSTKKLPPSRHAKVSFDPNDPETIRRIDSLFWLPVPRRCLMKMLPVWYGRNGQQKQEAIERDKQTGTHRGGSDALPGQHRERQARNT